MRNNEEQEVSYLVWTFNKNYTEIDSEANESVYRYVRANM